MPRPPQSALTYFRRYRQSLVASYEVSTRASIRRRSESAIQNGMHATSKAPRRARRFFAAFQCCKQAKSLKWLRRGGDGGGAVPPC